MNDDKKVIKLHTQEHMEELEEINSLLRQQNKGFWNFLKISLLFIFSSIISVLAGVALSAIFN